MFEETGIPDSQISPELLADIRQIENENISYKEMKKVKKERADIIENNQEKLVSS